MKFEKWELDDAYIPKEDLYEKSYNQYMKHIIKYLEEIYYEDIDTYIEKCYNENENNYGFYRDHNRDDKISLLKLFDIKDKHYKDYNYYVENNRNYVLLPIED